MCEIVYVFESDYRLTRTAQRVAEKHGIDYTAFIKNLINQFILRQYDDNYLLPFFNKLNTTTNEATIT